VIISFNFSFKLWSSLLKVFPIDIYFKLFDFFFFTY
jgi:hypothetical protein